jgi:hypothetical protein
LGDAAPKAPGDAAGEAPNAPTAAAGAAPKAGVGVPKGWGWEAAWMVGMAKGLGLAAVAAGAAPLPRPKLPKPPNAPPAAGLRPTAPSNPHQCQAQCLCRS